MIKQFELMKNTQKKKKILKILQILIENFTQNSKKNKIYCKYFKILD